MMWMIALNCMLRPAAAITMPRVFCLNKTVALCGASLAPLRSSSAGGAPCGRPLSEFTSFSLNLNLSAASASSLAFDASGSNCTSAQS